MIQTPSMPLRLQELSEELSKHDAFFWVQGMAMLNTRFSLNRVLEAVFTVKGARALLGRGLIPDLCDPATVGGLSYLASLATGHPPDVLRAKFDPSIEFEGEFWAKLILAQPGYGQFRVFRDFEDSVYIFDETLKDAAEQVGLDPESIFQVPAFTQIYTNFALKSEVPEELLPFGEPSGENEEGAYRVTMTAREWAEWNNVNTFWESL